MMSLSGASSSGEHIKPLKMSSHFGNSRESRRDSGRQPSFPDHDPEFYNTMFEILDEAFAIERHERRTTILYNRLSLSQQRTY